MTQANRFALRHSSIRKENANHEQNYRIDSCREGRKEEMQKRENEKVKKKAKKLGRSEVTTRKNQQHCTFLITIHS